MCVILPRVSFGSYSTEWFDIDLKLAVLYSYDRTEQLLFYLSWVYNYNYNWTPETVTETTSTTSRHVRVDTAIYTTSHCNVPPNSTRGNAHPHRLTPAILHQPFSPITTHAVANNRPNHTATILLSTPPEEFVVRFCLSLFACCYRCYFSVIIITLD